MKRITPIKCLIPFTRLSVHHHGYCYSCCPNWTKLRNVGRLTDDNSIMEIWNNENMQYLRKAILDDKLEKVCDFKYCPIAIKNEYLNLETLKNDDRNLNQIIDRIMAGRTIMDNPPYLFEVANSGRCNLKCIMCESNDKFRKNDDCFDEKLFTKIIPEILPDLSRLLLAGNGEVFFNPYSRKFLQTLDSNCYPALKIQLLTNGTMFTPELWESIRHNRFESIYVSIDAASKETYQNIRKNGDWDSLQRNLDLISELRRQNLFSFFFINFIVMKSNYQEMKDFADLGRKLGCDRIFFQKIFGCADIRENINFTNNKRVLTEVATILADPVFSRREVDTTLIDEYRSYSGELVSFGDDCFTKAKEWLFYVPIKVIFSMSKWLPLIFISYIRDLLRKKRVPAFRN